MNELLVNADDLGLHDDINRGILDCVHAGVVRSVSVCVAGVAVDWAQLRSLRVGGVRVGLHVTLTGERWLTTGDVVPDWPSLVRRLIAGGAGFVRIARAEIERQIEECRHNGIELDHLDSHQHIHVLPGLWQICLELAGKMRIARVRVPAAPGWRLARGLPGGWALQALALRRLRDVPSARRCIGLAHSGAYTLPRLEHEFRTAGGQDLELIVHPGVSTPSVMSKYGFWNYRWSDERGALLDGGFRKTVEQCGYRLTG